MRKRRSGTELGLPSPIVVRSGNGLHFYFHLTDQVTDILLWRAYAGGLLAALENQGVKLDARCSTDPVRLLRPPETLNHKNGIPLPVLVEDWGGAPVPIALFDQFKTQSGRARKPREDIAACTSMLDMNEVERLIGQVASAPGGERNHRLFVAACRLREWERQGAIDESGRATLAEAAISAGLCSWETERTIESAARTVDGRAA